MAVIFQMCLTLRNPPSCSSPLLISMPGVSLLFICCGRLEYCRLFLTLPPMWPYSASWQSWPMLPHPLSLDLATWLALASRNIKRSDVSERFKYVCMVWLSLLHFCHLFQGEFAWIASGSRTRRHLDWIWTQLASWNRACLVPATQENKNIYYYTRKE